MGNVIIQFVRLSLDLWETMLHSILIGTSHVYVYQVFSRRINPNVSCTKELKHCYLFVLIEQSMSWFKFNSWIRKDFDVEKGEIS